MATSFGESQRDSRVRWVVVDGHLKRCAVLWGDWPQLGQALEYFEGKHLDKKESKEEL